MPKLVFTFLVYYLALIVTIGLMMLCRLFFHICKDFIRRRILKILPDTPSDMQGILSG